MNGDTDPNRAGLQLARDSVKRKVHEPVIS